jgi:hypothetical protein
MLFKFFLFILGYYKTNPDTTLEKKSYFYYNFLILLNTLNYLI